MHAPRLLRPLALSCLVVMLSSPGRAAENWPVPRGDSHEPVPYRYDGKQPSQLPREFLDDYPACTIYSGLNVLIEADGTIEKTTHEVTRFNGRKGIERLGEYRNISYDPAYEKMTLHEARVFKTDGRVVAIEPKHVQLRDLSTDYQVYDHDKQLVISFPNLEVGDVIEVKWSVRGKNPEHHGQYFDRYIFGDDRYPVGTDELRVRLPKNKELKHATTAGTLKPTITEDKDYRIYHWRTVNRPPLPQDENLPSKDELHLAVSYSTFPNWPAIYDWKKSLRKDCWTCTPEVRKVIEETTRGLTKPIDKARALTYWVRRHVRYVSAGEKHDYTPHLPLQVLTNRYGDCKDQSQLLAVMLKEVGVQVALATLGTLDDGEVLEAVPSPWGTHAILMATVDGKDHWIDTTVSQAAWDYLPRDDRNRLCYVVDDKGLRLVRTPALTADENRVVQRSRISIGSDGSSRTERQCEFHGAAALSQRSEWLEVPPGERRRNMASELQNAQSKARLVRLNIDETKLRDFDQPVMAKITFEVPGHFSAGDEKDTMEGSLTDSKVWAKLLSNNLDYDRQVAMDLGNPFETLHIFTIQLPLAYRLTNRPQDHVIRSKWGTFTVAVRGDANDRHNLEIEMRLRMERTRIDPADFAEFRKFHEQVFNHYRVYFELHTTGAAEDGPALETLLALAPQDHVSADVLTHIYMLQDKRADAIRVLKRTLHYRPKKLALWTLLAQLSTEKQDVEAAYSEAMRLAPKDADWALRLAAKRIEFGDHEGAKKLLEPILQKGPEQWKGDAHYWLAQSLFKQKKLPEALKELNEAERLGVKGPTVSEVLDFCAELHEKLGQVKETIAVQRRQLELNSQDDGVLEALVRAEIQTNDTTQAFQHLRQYTVRAANDINRLVKAADFYYQLKRYDDAFELANQARDLGFHADGQRLLGLLYLQRGDCKKAIFHLDRANASADVLEGLIDANLKLGRLSEALKQVDRIDTTKPTTPTMKRTCTTLLAMTQRRLEVQKIVRIPAAKTNVWNAAIERLVCAEQAAADGQRGPQLETLLAEALAEGVELAPAYSLRGQLVLERGRLSLALADAERALALAPRDARAHYIRGRVKLERGQEGALADLSRAAELNQRKDADMLHWLATALHRAGARAEAVAAQREAVALRPNDEEMKEQLRELEKDK